MTRLVRAPNPGPMTLEGTNTWLVGRRRVLVVDPGPAEPAHLAAVLAEVARDGGVLGGVLLTHRHGDHTEALGLPRLRDALVAAGAVVLAVDPTLGCPPGPDALARATDEPVRLLPLPGHTDDSVGLVVPGAREVLTGDTVLGRGTSVVAHPDGDLGDHLASLEALLALVTTGGGAPWRGLPGHGEVLADLGAAVAGLRAHRLVRITQVEAAVAAVRDEPHDLPDGGDPAGDDLVGEVVARVYPDLTDPVLLGAAPRTVRATLVHLARS